MWNVFVCACMKDVRVVPIVRDHHHPAVLAGMFLSTLDSLGVLQVIQKISTAVQTKVHLLTHGSKFWYVHQIKKAGSYNMISQYKIYTIFIYYFLLLVCTWSESLFVICLIHTWWFLKAEEHLQSQLHKRKEKKKCTEQHLVLTLTADPS